MMSAPFPLPPPCLRCEHFDRKAVRCRASGEFVRVHVKAGKCPIGKWAYDPTRPKPVRTPRQSTADVMARLGPPLWADLHQTALAGQLTPEWLAAFAGRLPCGACRAEWAALVKASPLGPDDDQFIWAYNRHAEVNRKLGKPSPTLAEARAHWSAMMPSAPKS